MDSEAFRKYGKEMIDYVADQWDKMEEARPLPDIQPGYIKELVPSTPPTAPEEWSKIFADLDKVVTESNTNWHHPSFYAYFPTACSYQSIMADILSGGLASIGFTWKSAPSMTELEMATLDWLVQLLGLPEHFRNDHEGPGCGIIQTTASDATMIAIMSARARAVEDFKQRKETGFFKFVTDMRQTVMDMMQRVRAGEDRDGDAGLISPHYHDPAVFEKFVAYCSDQAHSSVEKGAMVCGVRLRKLKSTLEPTLGNYTVTKETLEAAIKEDRARGLIPFIMICTIGTTCSNGVDRLSDLGPVLNRERIWMHVDAAYAGSFLLCPEMRYMSEGMEMVDSFNFNAHKAMLVNFDCSPMWFKDGANASKYFNVDAVYLRHNQQANSTDYRHLQIALGRRFRSLKLWFVLRNMGVEHIENYLRKHCSLAELFSRLLEAGGRFDHFVPRHLGLVCFRIKNSTNAQNEALCDAINADRRIHLVPSTVHGTFFLRLAVCSQRTNEDHIRFAYQVCEEVVDRLEAEK